MQDKSTTPTEKETQPASQDVMASVIDKIASCENILIALSRNPSVDEMAAAIGLAIYLEETNKHVTAIYSGETPNVLEFLKPEETFETNTDSLQDFIIALDKSKADHLRYKIDGDFVKVFITPYKVKLGEDDLEYSYGDYNIDLVIALNVPTASDLDAALSEHGRIMHDASAIDITTSEPGRFGEIEWSDTSLSSVSEMVANLLFKIKKPEVKKEVATALLTGIVAATGRFSNENTKSSTMAMASKLMDCGADEQLVAMNMMDNSPAELIGAVDLNKNNVEQKADNNDGMLSVDHNDMPVENAQPENDATADMNIAGSTEQPAAMPNAVENEQPIATPPELDYSKMMEEALAESLPTAETPLEVSSQVPNPVQENINDQPQAMPENLAAAMAPEVPNSLEVNNIPEMQYTAIEPVAEENKVPDSGGFLGDNTPSVGQMGSETEPAGVAEESYLINQPEKVISPLPMPENDTILPPPVMPDVDFGAIPPLEEGSADTMNPVLPEVQPMPVVDQPVPVPQPASIPQPTTQPALPTDQPVDAFQIPNV